MWVGGEVYERYMGRWSRLVAGRFLRWLRPRAGCRWVDVGCGTGALSAAVLAGCQPAAVLGVDPSAGFLDHLGGRVDDPRLELRQAGAGALPVPTGSVDYVVSGLALNFMPELGRAAAEMRRVCRAGGTVAAYVWDYAAGMQLIRLFWDAAAELDPAAADLDEGRFPICQPAALTALLQDAGLVDVETTALVVPTVFADFDDYWSPFLNGQAPAPSYCAGLPEPARQRLRERLRASLPTAPDGTIQLSARAWSVRGTIPTG
jgi:SAM-dependent methyltransferase